MEAEMAPAESEGEVSFAAEIARVLLDNCSGCHIDARRPRGGLNMNSYRALLRGGDNGPTVRALRPADSLLVAKLRGTADGQRMPLGRPALDEATIARIEQWIVQGAKFDGPDPAQSLGEVASLAEAEAATHDQLRANRAELARRNWQLGMPAIASAQAESLNFFLLGNVEQTSLEDYAKRAESLVPRVAELLGARSDEPLLKGRMTLFIFAQRYDYSEFGQMVEKRELPRAWRGHWKYTGVDAYGAMIQPAEDDAAFDGLVCQLLAGTYLASLGDVPRWFAEGSARLAASRLVTKDRRVRTWDDALPRAMASLDKPDDFLTGKLPQADADVLSYSFARFLRRDSRRYAGLLAALGDGRPFAEAFSTVYGASPANLATAWARSAVTGNRRSR
jgi:mono/diheme cytochrome c family protein